MEGSGLRLGIYIDAVYSRDAGGLYTNEAAISFVAALAPRFQALTLFGRLLPTEARLSNAVPAEGIRFVALPHYPSLASPRAVVAGVHGSVAAFARALAGVDAVLLFGPHPLSFAFVARALLARKGVLLGVRQDFPEYCRPRLRRAGRSWAMPLAHVMEHAQRLLARRLPAIVVGEELGRRYRAGTAPVLATGFSLVRERDIVRPEDGFGADWTGELRLLSVGRLDPEKNPLLLAEVVARLRERDSRWRLDVVGEGPLEEELRRRAAQLGVGDAVKLLGYVPGGPGLRRLYREANAFLHVSFTEGVPQVLFEAQAGGTPIVATDVGGVGRALEDGRGGLLVRPGDSAAVARALERLRDSEQTRTALVEAGLRHAREHTMERALDRIAAFVQEQASR